MKVVPFTVTSDAKLNAPVKVVVPLTVKFVSFNNCNESDLNLPDMFCDPFFINANSRIPSSVPSVLSKIFPVIFA